MPLGGLGRVARCRSGLVKLEHAFSGGGAHEQAILASCPGSRPPGSCSLLRSVSFQSL